MILITRAAYLFLDACSVNAPEPNGLSLIDSMEMLCVAPIVPPFWPENPCNSIEAPHSTRILNGIIHLPVP